MKVGFDALGVYLTDAALADRGTFAGAVVVASHTAAETSFAGQKLESSLPVAAHGEMSTAAEYPLFGRSLLDMHAFLGTSFGLGAA